MELDKGQVRVLAFASFQAVQGLQWYLDRHQFSARRFQIFPARLGDESLPDHDLIWIDLDLGQPVPLENLRRKGVSAPGLASFQQPTPQQLLQLGELQGFRPVAWDGVNFEKIALLLDRVAEETESSAKSRVFLDSLTVWLSARHHRPGRLMLTNPPPGFPGENHFELIDTGRSLRVGGWRSNAAFRLPVNTAADLFELNLRDRQWSWVALVQEPHIEGPPTSRPIQSGDQIRIGPLVLNFVPPVFTEEILALAQRNEQLSTERILTKEAEAVSLEEAIRNLLMSAASGELRVQSGLKHASLCFFEGRLVHCVTGAVSGLKAVFRTLAWPESRWRFLPREGKNGIEREIDAGLSEFTRDYAAWQPRWEKARAFVPPPHIRLDVEAPKVRERLNWTYDNFLVLASVGEFHLVRDVFNNCPLLDIDIVEGLIELRRSGLIAVQRNFEGHRG